MGRDFLIFKPNEVTIDDNNYPTYVLLKQLNYFGPPEENYVEIADEDRLSTLTDLMNFSIENKRRTPFHMIQWPEISEVDMQFLLKIMKFDPRNRPTARELLQDPWLIG
jgi:serine/threonine protein kinase